MVFLHLESWTSRWCHLVRGVGYHEHQQFSEPIEQCDWSCHVEGLQLQSCLCRILMRTNTAKAIYHLVPSHMGLQFIVRLIIGFLLHIALHKYRIEFDNSGPARIRTQISGTFLLHSIGYSTLNLVLAE